MTIDFDDGYVTRRCEWCGSILTTSRGWGGLCISCDHSANLVAWARTLETEVGARPTVGA